jgi:hypothetical protein
MIMPMTADAEKEFLRIASGTLMALGTSEEAKPRLLARAMEPLIMCLFEPCSKENAMRALRYMCEDRSGLLPVVTALLEHTTLLVDVCGTQALPALNTLLKVKMIQPEIVLQAIASVIALEVRHD